ncbi:hypothetical protein FHR83_009319 [Actinoplanes campanulatus]|uniref:Uncharacterized protein n=1 Tax=Actinoplanes campanulatus TaxID=113559 RepID=A0A7W5FKH3_9ACTN|nr:MULTISPECIES: hypothetical protein [Actinoplanes]MBB3101590.1 hypothetical protein [Actinoplanes campanulatus]GGN48786.1 hypothetical protein GCM10010109_86210 [Actinoplanes campanulatus]GID41664.1 hypothetical protein Aca09nite_81700 [Actinoplanes campanulatus]GID47236.1 hypothetical protein Aca07nite_45110 [Actinoplanes capillaceus]
MATPPTLAADAVLGLLVPVWQWAIGLLVLVTVVLSARKLLMRGPTRMGGALLLAGAAVVALTALSYLMESL